MGPSGPNPAARPLGPGPGYLPYQRPFKLSARTLQHVAAATGVVAAAGTGAYLIQQRQQQQKANRPAAPSGPLLWLHDRSRQQQQPGSQQWLLPQAVADMLCGAIGEMVQVAVLYPLDTIKVRCQAAGIGVAAVVQQLGAQRSFKAAAGQLYAGVWSASLCSVLIGSLYYYSFCAAKRIATKFVAEAEARKAPSHQQQPATVQQAHHTAVAATAASLEQQAPSSLPQQQQAGSSGTEVPSSSLGAAAHLIAADQQQRAQHCHHHLPQGPGVDYHHDSVLAVICSSNSSAASPAVTSTVDQPSSVCPSAVMSAMQQRGPDAAAAVAAAASTGAHPPQQQPQAVAQQQLSDQGRAAANLMAAAAAAVVGALVEAPMELFKHRMQAGQVQGNMMAAMAAALRAGGPRALYWGFLPFCYKSLPYDMGELTSYSGMQDWRDSSLRSSAGSSSSNSSSSWPQTAVQGALAQTPEHVWDMLAGAAAGATAVLVSMPADCIKTVMETGGGVQVPPGAGVRATTAAFLATGRQLVARHGPQGLFMGLAPRLMEQVPSTMLYWAAVGACRRLLQPITDAGTAAAQAAQPPGAHACLLLMSV